MIIKRNSGATLQFPCVFKRSDSERLHDEYKIMVKRPDVYCEVLLFGKNELGQYNMVMPQLEEYTPTLDNLRSATAKLVTLWGKFGRSIDQQRQRYYSFIMSLDIPTELAHACRAAFSVTTVEGSAVQNIHGDATLQNTVYKDGEAFWIDPSPRYVPVEAEMDIAKMFLSLNGYDDSVPEMHAWLRSFTKQGRFSMRCVEYYYYTHIARIWEQQVERRDLLLDLAKRSMV